MSSFHVLVMVEESTSADIRTYRTQFVNTLRRSSVFVIISSPMWCWTEMFEYYGWWCADDRVFLRNVIFLMLTASIHLLHARLHYLNINCRRCGIIISSSLISYTDTTAEININRVINCTRYTMERVARSPVPVWLLVYLF